MSHCPVIPLAALLCLPAAGQNLVSYDVAAATLFESPAISPLHPAGGPLFNVWPLSVPLPPLPPIIAPPGAITIDGVTGLHWTTNGAQILADPHPAYPPGAPPIPPFPAPPLLGGPITGMAIDPLGGVLWMTDGVIVLGSLPVVGAPVVVGPFPVPTAGPMTGLDWDPLTGSLWAVDITGFAWNFLPGGAVIGGPFPPPGPLPGPPTGLALDKTGLPIAGGPRPVYVAAGGAVFEYFTGTVFPSGAPLGDGLSMHPAPQTFPATVCPCPGLAFRMGYSGPATAGNPTFGIDVNGLPPGTGVAWFFDFFPNLAFPLINTVGCVLGINAGAPTAFGLASVANPGGVATVPIPLTAIPAGLVVYLQPATFCPADPLGFVLIPVHRIAVSAP